MECVKKLNAGGSTNKAYVKEFVAAGFITQQAELDAATGPFGDLGTRSYKLRSGGARERRGEKRVGTISPASAGLHRNDQNPARSQKGHLADTHPDRENPSQTENDKIPELWEPIDSIGQCINKSPHTQHHQTYVAATPLKHDQ